MNTDKSGFSPEFLCASAPLRENSPFFHRSHLLFLRVPSGRCVRFSLRIVPKAVWTLFCRPPPFTTGTISGNDTGNDTENDQNE